MKVGVPVFLPYAAKLGCGDLNEQFLYQSAIVD
jgi:hypothetical protein